MISSLKKIVQVIELLLNEGSYGRIILVAVSMALLTGAIAAPLQEPSLQEALAYLNTLQSQEAATGKLRELYEILRRGEEIDEEAMPPAKMIELLQALDMQMKTDKRANYMSLCHFKICNMGRKRTLWPKN